MFVGKTANGQVLGAMTDFALLMSPYAGIVGKPPSTPCGPVGMKRPAEVVVEMLGGSR